MAMVDSERLDENFWVWYGRANAESLEAVRKLFQDEGESRTTELLKWQYLERLGGSYVAIAHTEEGIQGGAAALYAGLPTLVQVGNETVSAVQSFDSITANQFRGKGLFSRLGNYTYKKLSEQGVVLVYGIPNANINNARITQLGWRSLDPLPFLIKPFGLRYLRVRSRLRTPRISTGSGSVVSGSIRQIPSCPEDVSDLSSRSDLVDRVGVRRDYDYLTWRLARPGSSYRHFEFRSSSGSLLGYAVYELVIKHGCSVGYFMELITDVQHPESAGELAQAVLEDMRSRGADVCLAWWMESSRASSVLRQHGFFQLPERFRPIELHLGYRYLVDGRELSRDSFAFSYLDSDTV